MKFISIALALTALLALFVVSPAGAVPSTVTVTTNTISGATFVSNSGSAGTGTVSVVVVDSAGDANTGARDEISISVINATRNKTVTVKLSETVSATDFGASNNSANDTFGQASAFIVDTVANENLTANVPILGANDGDSIQVVAQPLVHVLTVDGTGPTISALSPTHTTVTRAQAVTFTGSIVDLSSGIKRGTPTTAPAASQITINVDGTDRTGLAAFTQNSANTGFDFSLLLFLSEAAHTFQVTAKDAAGNSSTSDADADTSGNQANTMEIDATAPALSSAKTGESWNADTGLVVANTRTSVHVQFVKTGTTTADKLNSNTISVTDFLVGDPGVNPTAIVFPNLAAGVTGNATGLDLRDDVFLTMATSFDPNAVPLVRVVGSVEDTAGNVVTSGQVTSADGIAPALTVTVTGEAGNLSGASTTTGKVTVRVVSDETIAAGVLPTITFAKLVGDDNTTTAGVNNAATEGATTESAVAGLANTFESTILFSATGAASEGLYHAKATVADAAGNTGIGGESTSCTTDGCVDLGKATLFQFDDEINNATAPTFTLSPNLGGANTDQTEDTSPFIRIDLNSEGTEYLLSTNVGGTSGTSDTIKGIANTSDIEIDASNGVTLSVVKLDGVDVSANVGTVDANSFQVSLSGLSVGSHQIEVNATDAVANTYTVTQKFSFKVVARAKYEIPLVPGNNFISLPLGASDASVSNVLSGTDATQVLSYQGGEWLLATKDTASGTFVSIPSASGRVLTTMEAGKGYWVTTTSFSPIKVDVPLRDYNAVPPTIGVTTGWNMVGVIDLQLRAAGTTQNEALYFGSLGTTWSVAYTFDTTNNVWVKLLPDATITNVGNGKGYWLWVTADGTLVP